MKKDTGKEDMLAVMMNVIDEHNGGKIPDEVLIGMENWYFVEEKRPNYYFPSRWTRYNCYFT